MKPSPGPTLYSTIHYTRCIIKTISMFFSILCYALYFGHPYTNMTHQRTIFAPLTNFVHPVRKCRDTLCSVHPKLCSNKTIYLLTTSSPHQWVKVKQRFIRCTSLSNIIIILIIIHILHRH